MLPCGIPLQAQAHGREKHVGGGSASKRPLRLRKSCGDGVTGGYIRGAVPGVSVAYGPLLADDVTGYLSISPPLRLHLY